MTGRAAMLHIGISSVLFATSLIGQTATFAPPTDVSFSISTERSSYSNTESVTVKYEIVNVSNTPLYAPRAVAAICPPEVHMTAWFENGEGQHFGHGGIGSSCSPTELMTTERMNKAAVLLNVGEHLDDTWRLTPFGLPPGTYQIEAILSGWDPDKFASDERTQLASMGHPFLRGEVSASVRITLTREE